MVTILLVTQYLHSTSGYITYRLPHSVASTSFTHCYGGPGFCRFWHWANKILAAGQQNSTHGGKCQPTIILKRTVILHQVLIFCCYNVCSFDHMPPAYVRRTKLQHCLFAVRNEHKQITMGKMRLACAALHLGVFYCMLYWFGPVPSYQWCALVEKPCNPYSICQCGNGTL